MMISCKYCHTSYKKFQPICSGCGAVLKGSGTEEYYDDPSLPTIERVKLLSKRYSKLFPSLFANEIASSKMNLTAISFRNFPAGKEIFFFCDTTPMGSGIWGFLLAEDGLYWKNEETTPTKRTYISWDQYTKEDFQPQRAAINLSDDSAISLAGIKRYEDRERVFQFFKELKKIIVK